MAEDAGGPEPGGEEPLTFYSRAGLHVETYDVATAEIAASGVLSGDTAFYEALAREAGGPILELGCGSGRVAWALARAGFEVWGLDRSEAMLERARAREVGGLAGSARFVAGDMADFELPAAFGLAIFPGRSFQSLLEPAQQRSCLDAVRRHLRSGGMVSVHLFDPRLDLCVPEAGADGPVNRGLYRHPDAGTMVSWSTLGRRNDPLRQRIEELWEFVEHDATGGILRRQRERLRLRWTYRWEMRYLLELAGFRVEAEFSDFHRAPPAYGKEQVWVARRP